MPVLMYGRLRESMPTWNPRRPAEKPMPDLLKLRCKPGASLTRRWNRRDTDGIVTVQSGRVTARHPARVGFVLR
jgi:hypothetical protein